jgi:ArsR family transcriptional regulator
MLKALANPIRLRILRFLCQRNGAHACEIEEHLDRIVFLEQSSVAHHLRVLRNAGLVQRRGSGKETRYSVHDTALKRWEQIDAWIRECLQ